MNFELIISGLCIVALKSVTSQPKNPDEVDIICPHALMHKVRLSYSPVDVQTEVEPEMIVDITGNRFSSVDVAGRCYEISFSNSSYNKFVLNWENDPQAQKPGSERSMNWVPTLADLGFDDFKMAKPGKLPPGAATRFKLPYGDLNCNEVVWNADTNDYALWKFPAADSGVGHVRAVANVVVFSVNNVGAMSISQDGESDVFTADVGQGLLQMCLSNDMENVPYNYNSPVKALDHLAHLDAITFGDFKVPTLKTQGEVRTGHPICNQVIFNYI